MLKKIHNKCLSSVIALSLGITLSYGAVPAKPAEAFNWGNLAGAIFVTTAQQQQLEKQLNYLDNDGRHEYFNKIKSELGENQSYSYNAILDDREFVTMGAKMKDCKILGTPYLVVIGDKQEGDKFELENIATGERKLVTQNELIEILR